MPRLTRDLSALLAAGVLALGAAGCGGEETEGAANDAGESVEQNAPRNEEEAGNAAEDAGNAIDEAAGEAGDAAEDAERELEEQTP